MKDSGESEHPFGEIISTGHPEIDKKLGGGVPCGSLTLVEGQSDAGKSVLAQQMIWGSLSGRHRVVLFTTENTVRSFNTQMRSLGLDILDYLLLGWLKIYPIESSKSKNSATFDIILSEIDKQRSYDMIVVDSLTPVIVHNPAEMVLGYFDQCKGRCDKGRTIINIAHSYAFDEGVLIRLRSLCDAHFKLHIEEVGDKLVKVLDVAKVRGADQITGNSLSFDVLPGMGMRIMPLNKAKA
jgi:Predicted ATPases involved in biogenesis of archaeal flagella